MSAAGAGDPVSVGVSDATKDGAAVHPETRLGVIEAVAVFGSELSAVVVALSNAVFDPDGLRKEGLVNSKTTIAEITAQSRIPMHPNTR